jgi:hypothetical protein
MARVFVEGDHEALDRITAALRAAGLSIDIELMARPPEVRRLPSSPRSWTTYADLGADLSYADWRDDVLSRLTPDQPATSRPAPARPGALPGELRPTG